MLTLKNISYQIKDKTLVEDVSANFQKGKINLILGPNGAGKSTLIKLMSGELKPSSGQVFVEDEPLVQIPLAQQAKFRAVLSQNLELSFPLKVHEVVMMGRYPHFESKPQEVDKAICDQAMDRFDLQQMFHRNYLTLSGGEKQRVQFARVFAQIWQASALKYRLLLLDEPLTFLDIYYQYELMQQIKDFMKSNPDLTVIGVVHDLNIAAHFADHTFLIKASQLFKQGTIGEVLTEENIYEVFKVQVMDRFIMDKL